MNSKSELRRMPAEWEKHSATWIAWPHEESDWPRKFEAIDWVYAEIARLISSSESLNIIVKDSNHFSQVKNILNLSSTEQNFNLHILATDRSWLRDSAPTAVVSSSGNQNKLELIAWQFKAWAKYENYKQDQNVPELVSKIHNIDIVIPKREDNITPVSLEGGAIETDGQGTLMVTRECLLSDIQIRNPGMNQKDYELLFQRYLGIKKTIWLEAGCAGDDTHGHIDDIARFTPKGNILLAYEEDPKDENHKISSDNYRILTNETDASGNKINVIKLPMPRKIDFDGYRLPASYANFYITNKSVIVPVFNDANDLKALEIIQREFPRHATIGISAVDLVLGFGTLHCLTQQIPAL